MNEAEYVVPPSNGAPNVSGSAPKPPKQPNKVVAWAKSNVATTIAGSVMALIVILFGVALVTNQKLEFAGISLNPLYQQANCPEPTPEDPFPDCGSGGPQQPPIPVTDAPIVRFTIADGNDSSPNLPGACDAGEIFGPGSVVATNGAADCLKISITNPLETYNKDFRICFSLDSSGSQCTPWASDGGGNSAQIMSGGSFSTAGVTVETRALPEGQKIGSVQVGVQVFYQKDDGPCGASSGMEWAKALQGQNISDPWSYGDQQDDDPGCAQISLQSQVVTVTPPPSADLTIESAFEPATLGEMYFSKLKAVNAGDANCTFSFKGSTPEIGDGVIDTSYRNPDGSIMVDQIKFVGSPQTPGDYTVTIGVECSPKVGDGPTKTATKTFNLKVNDVPGVPPGNTGLDLTANLPDGIVGTKYSGGVQTIHVGTGSSYTCRATVKNISPAIGGAYVINAYAISGELNGTLVATPKTAGTYTVTFHAICFSRDARYPVPTVVFDKDFQWVVKTNQIDPPAPTSPLDITANFSNGTVGKAFSTQVKTVNGSQGGVYTCDLALGKINPDVTGATLLPDAWATNFAKPDDASSTFAATPKAEGNYVVSITATCNPKDPFVRMASITKTKDFTWKVTASPIKIDPTPGGELSISATFANGKVGQAYNTSVSTVNGSSNCSLALVSVSPAIAGAMLDQVSNVGGNPTSSAITDFRATPTTAGTYTVKISATCPPLVGDGPTRFVEKSFNWIVDVATVTGGGSGSGGGSTPPSTANVCSTYSNKLVPIYRWWNDTVKDHFYTMNANEKPTGYVSEGISAYIFSEKIPGSTALYRSFSAPLTAHYYSTVDDAEKYGYKTEGIMGYVFSTSTTGTVPWYRLHKGWPANDYLETLSTKEKSEAMSKLAYTDAGIAAYLCGSK